MPKDDFLDIELEKLEKEIESKVDKLFVDSELAEERQSFSLEEEGIFPEIFEGEDAFSRLREYFLTLDWEINANTIKGLLEEVQRLEELYRGDKNIATLLGLMDKALSRLIEPGDRADRETISFLNRAKEALFQIVGPEKGEISDPEKMVMEMEAQYERLIGFPEEEFKETVAMEAIPEVGFDEIEKVIERTIRPEGEPLEKEAGKAIAEEKGAIRPSEEEVHDEFEYYKRRLLGQTEQLRSLIERFHLAEDLLGHKRIFDKMVEDIKALSRELIGIQEDLQENVQRLSLLSFQPLKEAIEKKPPLKDLIFVSIANRIFAFPAESIQALFRVPMEYSPIVSKMKEIQLKSSIYPLIWLGERVGIQKGLTVFPKEARILLVRSGEEMKAILVDKIIARQEVEVKEIQKEEHQELFSGIAIIPKGAFVIDSKLL